MTVMPHEWLLDRRERQHLQPSDIAHRTFLRGDEVSTRTLTLLESGRLFLSSLRPGQAAALCTVLGITRAEWAHHSAQLHSTRPAGDPL